jgi:hypothetical protein
MFQRRLSIVPLSALALSACIVAPYPRHAVYYEPGPPRGVMEVDVAPPPPYVEVVPPMPFVEGLWIGGYWGWGGGRHQWVPGRWEHGREGYAWRPHAWTQRGGRWQQQEGGWQRR